MLILSSVMTQVTNSGPRHMLLFTSPRAPGSHYEVEVDSPTAAKMRTLISIENQIAVAASGALGASPDEDELPYGRFQRG